MIAVTLIELNIESQQTKKEIIVLCSHTTPFIYKTVFIAKIDKRNNNYMSQQYDLFYHNFIGESDSTAHYLFGHTHKNKKISFRYRVAYKIILLIINRP